jgi:hypothetical protein
MATETEISELRRMISEPTPATYDDTALGLLIDEGADLSQTAARVWREKAAAYAEIVDVKEGSSSRNLGDIYEQALSMAQSFDAQHLAQTGPLARTSRTRPIERA